MVCYDFCAGLLQGALCWEVWNRGGGGSWGGSVDLEGGVGCRVEIKGAFGLEEGWKGRELWFSLEVFNTQKLIVEPVGVEGGGVERRGNTGDRSSSRWRKREQHRLQNLENPVCLNEPPPAIAKWDLAMRHPPNVTRWLRFQLWNLAKLQQKALSVCLRTGFPISFLWVVKNSPSTQYTEGDEEEMQEATTSLANAKQISTDAALAAVYQNRFCLFSPLKEHETAMKTFPLDSQPSLAII